MPPIKFRRKNGKQTPSGTRILRRVRRQLILCWHYETPKIADRELIPLAIADIDLCLGRCDKKWRDRI